MFIAPRRRDSLVQPVDVDSGSQCLSLLEIIHFFGTGCGHGVCYTVYYAERVNRKLVGTIMSYHGCRDISHEILYGSLHTAADVVDCL